MPDDPLHWVDEENCLWQARGLTREPSTRIGPQGGRCIEVAGRTVANFGANDYLGLANDPRLVAAAQQALSESGFGAGASPLVTGRGYWHAALEEALAQFEETEEALLFPTGYAANAGTIPALVGRGDAIFSDAKNHASIIDGCRLSAADLYVYEHCNVEHLAELLAKVSGVRRHLIVTDGLFSMDGDLAPLPDIVTLAEQYGAMVMVDEAHATGVFGEHGRGVCEQLQVEERVSVRVGTLSKALGSAGGFVAGSSRLIQWLRNRARTYMFSTAMPEALAAAGCRALEIVREEPQRRRQLLAEAREFRRLLQTQNYDLGKSNSQIIPIILGNAERTMHVARRLREAGFFVPGIRPPSVPEGESLLRISLSVDHDSPLLLEFLTALDHSTRAE